MLWKNRSRKAKVLLLGPLALLLVCACGAILNLIAAGPVDSTLTPVVVAQAATTSPTETKAPVATPTEPATSTPESSPTAIDTPPPTATIAPEPTAAAVVSTATLPPATATQPAVLASTPLATDTGALVTGSALAALIKAGLERQQVAASDVSIADGRANGGERVCLISWRAPSEATDLKQLLTYLGRVFGAVHAANRTAGADLDSVVVIVTNQTDTVVSVVAVNTEDVAALVSDEITEAEFLARMNVENF